MLDSNIPLHLSLQLFHCISKTTDGGGSVQPGLQEVEAGSGEAASGTLEQLAATVEGHAEEVSQINQALEDKADNLALQDLQVGSVVTLQQGLFLHHGGQSPWCCKTGRLGP